MIMKAITKSTTGNTVFISDLCTVQTMQDLGAPDICLQPWLADETTISRLLQDGAERGSADNSLGIAAPGEQRPDIMMVGLTTKDLCDKDSRGGMCCKADSEEPFLVRPQKITVVEMENVADTMNDNKFKAKTKQHRSQEGKALAESSSRHPENARVRLQLLQSFHANKWIHAECFQRSCCDILGRSNLINKTPIKRVFGVQGIPAEAQERH